MDNEVKFRVQGGRFFGGGRFCFWGVLFGSSGRGLAAAVLLAISAPLVSVFTAIYFNFLHRPTCGFYGKLLYYSRDEEIDI